MAANNMGLGRIVGHDMMPRRSRGGLGAMAGGMPQGMTVKNTVASGNPVAGNTGIVPPAMGGSPVPATPATPAPPKASATGTPATPAAPVASKPPAAPKMSLADQVRISNERANLSFLANGATEGPGGSMVMAGGPASTPAVAPEWQQQRNAALNSGGSRGDTFSRLPVAQQEALAPLMQAFTDKYKYENWANLTRDQALNFALEHQAGRLNSINGWTPGQDPSVSTPPAAAPPAQTIAAGEPNPSAPAQSPLQRMNALKAEIAQLKAAQGGNLTPDQEAYYGPLWNAAFQAAKVVA